MKRFFGSLLLRMIRGGIVLRTGEYQIVSSMLAELPDHVRDAVAVQFDEFNLVQRSREGRVLIFSKASIFSAKSHKLPITLCSNSEDASLIRVSVATSANGELLHATLKAVAGKVFWVHFSQPVPLVKDEDALKITKVTHLWRG